MKRCKRPGCSNTVVPNKTGRPRELCDTHATAAARQAYLRSFGRDRRLDYSYVPIESDPARLWLAGNNRDREIAEHLAREQRDLFLGKLEGRPPAEVPVVTRLSCKADPGYEDEPAILELGELSPFEDIDDAEDGWELAA